MRIYNSQGLDNGGTQRWTHDSAPDARRLFACETRCKDVHFSFQLPGQGLGLPSGKKKECTTGITSTPVMNRHAMVF